MAGSNLLDRAALRAYLLTKLAVLVVALLVTWPLARLVGPKAWVALGAFAALLALVAVAVLLAARFGSGVASGVAAETREEEEPDPEGTVVVPVEDCLDLHSFPPGEVPRVVEDYLEAAHGLGFAEVRLIHGRGIGVQRERVRSLLARHPLVASFHDAPPERGGWGATVVYLGRAVSDQPSADTSPGHP